MPTWTYKSTTGKTTRKIEGLGDVVEKVTSVLGIKSLVERRAKKRGRPCGCAKRREALNERFPFKKKGGEDNE